mmetsp:Transcript_75927/g.180498  ORF Transcript_75927/g.180498 Transcript_75927/m.180498 type:complete len:275 (+) Transcript_75927:1373-2197(+)
MCPVCPQSSLRNPAILLCKCFSCALHHRRLRGLDVPEPTANHKVGMGSSGAGQEEVVLHRKNNEVYGLGAHVSAKARIDLKDHPHEWMVAQMRSTQLILQRGPESQGEQVQGWHVLSCQGPSCSETVQDHLLHLHCDWFADALLPEELAQHLQFLVPVLVCHHDLHHLCRQRGHNAAGTKDSQHQAHHSEEALICVERVDLHRPWGHLCDSPMQGRRIPVRLRGILVAPHARSWQDARIQPAQASIGGRRVETDGNPRTANQMIDPEQGKDKSQ